MTELRGHNRVLQALRDTQLEQGRAIANLVHRVDQVHGGVEAITRMLTTLIEREGPPPAQG